MRHFKTSLTIIGAVTILVLAGNTIALAATGKALILGQVNKANKMTTVQRTTSGPAAKFTTKSSANAPFAVTGRGKVANLNADKLDGLDSTSLLTRSYQFTGSVTNSFDAHFDLPIPNGTYLITYSNFFDGAGNTPATCIISELNPPAPIRYTGATQIETTTGFPAALSGAGVVTKKAGGTITVACDVQSGTFSTPSNHPIEITATPTHLITSKTLTPNP